jgi:hypothetical protein
MLCLPYYAYVFSSTKLEIREEPSSARKQGEWEGEEMEGEGNKGEK